MQNAKNLANYKEEQNREREFMNGGDFSFQQHIHPVMVTFVVKLEPSEFIHHENAWGVF